MIQPTRSKSLLALGFGWLQAVFRELLNHFVVTRKSTAQKPCEIAPLKYLALFGAWLDGRHAVRPSGSPQCLGLIDFQASADYVERVGNTVSKTLSSF